MMRIYEDEEEEERTMSSVFDPGVDPTKEIAALFDELEGMLKSGDVMNALGARGVNASLALTAIHGLRAYLIGEKAKAAEDFGLVAEEIAGRLGLASPPDSDKSGNSAT